MARLLLADDDSGNRMTLGALLEDDGHDLTEAASLAEAKAVLEKKQFDVVVTDYDLGDGMGTELLAVVQALSPRPKLLLCSGHHLINDDRLRKIDAVVPKGSDYLEMQKALRRLLGD